MSVSEGSGVGLGSGQWFERDQGLAIEEGPA